MYLYKRHKTYWVEYMVGGVRHRESTHAKTLKDAKFFADSIDAARRAPTLDDAISILKTIWRERQADKMPLADAWSNYTRMANAVGKLNVTAKTLKDRQNRVQAFMKWAEGNAATVKHVEDVSGNIAILYAQHLADAGKKSHTRKNIITDLSTIWRMLEKTSSAIRNPWENLTPQCTDGERGEPFTREQEESVLKAAKEIGKQWYEICMLAKFTGLRYGSCAHLEWDDVNMKDRTIFTSPSKTKRFGITVAIPIVAPLMDVLKKMAKAKNGPSLFPVHEAMYDQNGGKDIMKFREVLDRAKVNGSGYTFHSWRHTFRTRLAESGADIETAMRLCGHTQKETSRRYDHAKHIDESRKAMEAMMEKEAK